MLQIPSSLVSLSSRIFIGLCGGFFIGGKVMFTQLIMSIPKNSATRTTTDILLPTTCALSTPDISVSHIALIGYAAAVSTSLVCILCAKGFFTSVASEPPTPPPALSGSYCGEAKKRGWTWLWLIVILLGIIILCLGFFYKLFGGEEGLPGFTTPWIQAISFLERSYLDGLKAAMWLVSAAKSHIAIHGGQYAQILLLTLSSHSVCILFAVTLERLLKYVVSIPLLLWGILCETVLIPILIIGSTARLNWIFWFPWYWELSVRTLSFLDIVHRLLPQLTLLWTAGLARPMVSGPFLVHTATMGLRIIVLALYWMPCAMRSITRQLRWAVLLDTLRACATVLAIFVGYWGVAFTAVQYRQLSPATQQLVWKSFLCAKSRAELWSVYSSLVGDYLKWKAIQTKDFPALFSTIWDFLVAIIKLCARTWGALACGHKLLIIVPALIFYCYFYLIPAAREFKDWRRRRRR
ncbi:hypothetical protein B0H15DRAFT_952168 [Mycena belliarum]|uniref:Uncharacterized protein n=1 Tax=Mycena belliarum TaxID=1033014 RepID=A0AAD6U0Z8_9AGAR|nr:hypothetical protein B0H15DRAFT_952168 [Mycena belliae]